MSSEKPVYAPSSEPRRKARTNRTVLDIGSVVMGDRVKVTETLSVGKGMSNVYLATDLNLGKTWVLKQIIDPNTKRGLVDNKTFKKYQLEYDSLIHEAKIMQSLEHQGIPRIAFLEEDPYTKSTFILMDYINGKDAQHFISTYTMVEEELAVKWVRQLCGILSYLHNLQNPVVYRDIKPSNMMIARTGVHLIDFGTAEVITPDKKYPKYALGTPGYAAPEQVNKSNPLTTQSDIFAIGATLYHLLSGKIPNARIAKLDEKGNPVLDERGKKVMLALNPKEGPYDLLKVFPDASPGLDLIIKRCTQPNLADRYQTIEEVIEALSNYTILDKASRGKMRRQIHTVYAIGVLSALLIGGSAVPYVMHNDYVNNLYSNSVEAAEKSGNIDDYVTAISQRPANLDPYFGMISAIQSDGTFSSEEEVELLGLINPNLTEIKNQERFPELAFEIGKLYWFYYATSEDVSSLEGRVQSTKWFEDAIDGGFYGENDIAKTYHSIGTFDQTISGAVREAEDGGKYSEYWDNLVEAKSKAKGEIVQLQINIAISDAINNYGYRLNTDGVPRDEVDAQVKDINKYLETAQPSDGAPKVLYGRLKESSTGLSDKVALAYKSQEG